MSKKRKPAEGLLPRTEAWRQSCSEYKARVHRLVIDDEPHQGVDGQPVRMVPAMRAKILDKITAAAAAHEDRQRNLGRRPKKSISGHPRGAKTLKLIAAVLSRYEKPGLREHVKEQHERYRASTAEPVDYRYFKEIRLEILKKGG